jgi:hypothetical protein
MALTLNLFSVSDKKLILGGDKVWNSLKTSYDNL